MLLARARGPGAPDVACDLVAAAIVGEYVRRDPESRLQVAVQGGHGALFVTGDVVSKADFDVAAVVRQALGAVGIPSEIEPFVMMESVAPASFPMHASRDPVGCFGYATEETPEGVPLAVAQTQLVARALETRRTQDPDWYWLGADYEVCVERRGPQTILHVRVQHVETVGLPAVREAVFSCLRGILSNVEVRVNAAGAEASAGFASRIGASGQATVLDTYGALLPAASRISGMHPTSPIVAGTWLARAAARSLVRSGKARAAMVHLTWLPLETRPASIRVRNERGEDLSALLSPGKLDLAVLPAHLRDPDLLTRWVRAPFDATVALPWETEDLLG